MPLVVFVLICLKGGTWFKKVVNPCTRGDLADLSIYKIPFIWHLFVQHGLNPIPETAETRVKQKLFCFVCFVFFPAPVATAEKNKTKQNKKTGKHAVIHNRARPGSRTEGPSSWHRKAPLFWWSLSKVTLSNSTLSVFELLQPAPFTQNRATMTMLTFKE